MSAESSKSEPTWLKGLAATVLVCVAGGVACLLAGARPGTILFAIALGVIVLAATLAIACAVILHRRGQNVFTNPSRALFENLTALPLPAEGVAWVSVSPEYAKRIHRIMWISYAAPFLILMPLFLLPDSAAESVHAGTRSMHRLLELITGVSFVVMAACVILAGRGINRHLRSRLGVDGMHLLYDPGTGEVERHEWSAVLTNKAALLIGRRIVSLVRSGFGEIAMFPPEALRGFILARLRQSSFVPPIWFQWNAFKRGNAELWVAAVSLVFLGSLHVASEFKPEWQRAVRDALITWIVDRSS